MDGPHGGQREEAKDWVLEVPVVLGSLSHVMGRQRDVWFGMRGGGTEFFFFLTIGNKKHS